MYAWTEQPANAFALFFDAAFRITIGHNTPAVQLHEMAETGRQCVPHLPMTSQVMSCWRTDMGEWARANSMTPSYVELTARTGVEDG
eukprot:scaffold681828_cov53-Prasinocladus_malaysianus.AAC.1